MSQIVKIKSIEKITHDVLKIVTEKPNGIKYNTGQAVDVSINKKDFEQELRAFTFTSLPDDNFLEFIIKTYPLHKGVTNQLRSLTIGDELIIGGVFGDISYKGEGIFIAGGAGITPFLAIFKELEKQNIIGNNKLIFANKTKADIILENDLKHLLGKNYVNVLSDEKFDGYEHGFITAEIIKKQIHSFTNYFYLCGPEPMMNAVLNHLKALGVPEEFIVKEAF
ncbi:MAG: flavodoxin reductase [Bacteroidetes bacterium]|nr:flavodoxin reductase [Bacteroidota bacterium]